MTGTGYNLKEHLHETETYANGEQALTLDDLGQQSKLCGPRYK